MPGRRSPANPRCGCSHWNARSMHWTDTGRKRRTRHAVGRIEMALLLYVDDEETIGRAVSRWFERRAHEVHLARSVEDAKQVLTVHEPAAIFIDVWLGKESGFE